MPVPGWDRQQARQLRAVPPGRESPGGQGQPQAVPPWPGFSEEVWPRAVRARAGAEVLIYPGRSKRREVSSWIRNRGLDGVTRDYYVRQFHDWKGGADVDKPPAG